ncbi:MAG: hypothetical protein O7E51_07225 [Acidobacteria bacterium]|nr:hypothetical protein [Acidobacteriota bacterium]
MNMKVTKEQLLGEVEDLLRTMQPVSLHPAGPGLDVAWVGRLLAVIQNWRPLEVVFLKVDIEKANGITSVIRLDGSRGVSTLLHQARHDLRMQTIGPANVAISQGGVFDYFDEIRQIIELAKQDILFVDPYLDAEFVSRYLSHIADGVIVRLLARERLPTLIPAVNAFAQQHNRSIEIRSAPKFHDRYIFIDKTSCYQSGASFKDGAKSAPTTLTQITDAFDAVRRTYEDLWARAEVKL